MTDEYKGNKHIPYTNNGDEDEPLAPATTPNEPIFVPNKKGDLKNTLTDEKA